MLVGGLLQMMKTIWVKAYFQRKGRWEEYEEATGEMKRGFLGGVKPVMSVKRRWVEIDEYSDTQIDGARLSRDTQSVLDQLESQEFDVMAITPVTSGHYGWTDYSSAMNGGAPTCASWGFGATSGVMLTAKKRLNTVR